MGKGRDRRRRRRRLRHESAERVRAASYARAVTVRLTPGAIASIARVLARFRSLRCQGGLRFGFTTFGPLRSARDPAELAAHASSRINGSRRGAVKS